MCCLDAFNTVQLIRSCQTKTKIATDDSSSTLQYDVLNSTHNAHVKQKYVT